MPDYCDSAAMVDRFGETELIRLTDRSMAEILDEQVLGKAIADASAEIDGYLAGRYKLPLAVVPEVLTRVCCDMTRYYLHNDGAPEEVRNRYDRAISFLRDVSKGAVSLGLDANDATPNTVGGVQMETGSRVHGRGNGGIV